MSGSVLTKEACLEFLRKAAESEAAPSVLLPNPDAQKEAREFIDFLGESSSPFHAVDALARRLESAGFKKLDERNDWGTLPAGSKCYLTKNQSTLLAFVIPAGIEDSAPLRGFTAIGAHTDSPVLRVKPVSKANSQGFLQVAVETYGGGLWHTWFDRDLGLAGRVIVDVTEKEDDEPTEEEHKKIVDSGADTSSASASALKPRRRRYESRLVRIDRPILRVSTLAIHLDREVRSGFKFNNETHLIPHLATEAAAQLNATKMTTSEDDNSANSVAANGHHSLLIEILAQELGVRPSQIIDLDLSLFDTVKPCLGGALNEFVYSARLDNLCSCFVGLRALLNVCDDSKMIRNVPMLLCFDNEEVGSTSARGADSDCTMSLFRRLMKGRGGVDALDCGLRRSLIVSSDMAHAVHPNYSGKHEGRHRPKMHEGLVIKYNANQRYATTMETAHFISEACRREGVPFQKFVVRQDMGCGSTIGPMLSAKTGVRTVDVGIAQLSMHSIREVCGIRDVVDTVGTFTRLYREFAELDEAITVD